MSRYTLVPLPHSPTADVTVGWDRAIGRFYLRVVRPAAPSTDTGRGNSEAVLEAEFTDLQEVLHYTAWVAHIPDDLYRVLRQDRRSEGGLPRPARFGARLRARVSRLLGS